MKEEKICTFTQNGTRLQLIKLQFNELEYPKDYKKEIPYTKYQIRLNRKIIKSSLCEFVMRKLFAQMTTSTVLQLKLYDND